MTNRSNKKGRNSNIEDWEMNEDFFNGPITPAHRILYAKLHRMISSQYEDPYEKGPQKMARYFDSFLEFFRQEYPQDKNCKGSLKSLIPKKSKIVLPDGITILVEYNMENQQSSFKITSKEKSVSKLTDRHAEVALIFKNNVQAGIFNTITMLIDAMPKDAREKMEEQYLTKARSSDELIQNNEK